MKKTFYSANVFLLAAILLVCLPTASTADNLPLKISVIEKGIYRISCDDLTASGWSPTDINPLLLQLQNQGKEVAFYAQGMDDGRLDDGDYLLFYGEPYLTDMTHIRADNRFTLENIYWLSVGEVPGTHMATQALPPSSRNTLTDYKDTVRIEQDLIMRSDHIDSYFWENFPDYDDTTREDPGSKSFTIDLPACNPDKPAAIMVKLKGENNTPGLDPDHHLTVDINSTWKESAYFDGWRTYLFEEEVPSGNLIDGENTITITNILDLSEDLIRLDWIEIAYSRHFIAKENELFFNISEEGEYDISVSGFSTEDIVILDVTEPLSPIIVSGDTSAEDGGYSLSFGDAFTGEHFFVAAGSSAIKTPTAITAYTSANLADASAQADYIMITHTDFKDALQPLVTHRKQDGYQVLVADVQNIYDEFNYGLVHPQAIKKFLEQTYYQHDNASELMVLLVGDGTSDAGDRLGMGTTNYIPVYFQLSSDWKLNVTDTWYTQVSGDDLLSDIIIGRLPVKTPQQLTRIIDRIITYEQSDKEYWMRNAFFIAGNDKIFVSMNEQLASLTPFNYQRYFFNRSEETDLSRIFNFLYSGMALTVYSGHGNIQSWNGLINTGNLSGLSPQAKPTFLITLDCRNGHFANPTTEGLAEEFLRAPGGPLACFAPVGTGYAYEHEALAYRLFDLIFNDNETVIGKAIKHAKEDVYLGAILSDNVYEQYILLGDPATKFKRCRFSVNTPHDNQTISREDSFTWDADGYTRFVIQFSISPDFLPWEWLPIFTFSREFSPGPIMWHILSRMADTYGSVWWRVGCLPNKWQQGEFWKMYNEEIPFTEPLQFTITNE